MDQHQLDQEKRELLASFEEGEWRSVPDLASGIERHQQEARATLKKDRRVNIRLTAMDLEAIQRKAVEDGIPYQTLMASVLHKYVTGRLVENPDSTR